MSSLGGNANKDGRLNAVGINDAAPAGGSSRLVLPRFLRKPYRVVTRIADGGFSVPVAVWAGLLVVALVGTGIAGWVSQQERGSVMASVGEAAGFKVREVQFKGNERVATEALEFLLGDQLDATMFEFDAEKAREAVLQNSWIRSAGVVKVYPDVVAINVVEREPFAVWQAEDEVRLIAIDGVVLKTFEGNQIDEAYAAFPRIVGGGGNHAAADFVSTMRRFPALEARSKAYIRVATRRWDIEMDNGVRVMLPEADVDAALLELQSLQEKEEILERDLLAIDLRLADRTFIQLSENSAKQHRDYVEAAKSAEKKAVRKRKGQSL